jgi:hypothetical protein
MGHNKVEIKDGNPIITWEAHKKKTRQQMVYK